MKPAPFRYVRAEDLDHALTVLSEHGDDVKVIAGGQSLLPLMNLRLVQPAIVLDIARLSGSVREAMPSSGATRIGALVTHRQLETWDASGPLAALVRHAASSIGHLPIRTRGTFGGSLAHADPASEWALVAVLCGARIEVLSSGGSRLVPAEEFLAGFLSTTLADDELLVGAELPALPPRAGAGFAEYCRRAGDFATALAGAVVSSRDGVIVQAQVAVGGGSGPPTRVEAAEAVLTGAAIVDDPAVDEAAHQAGWALECQDGHGLSVATRRRIATACVRRALQRAMAGVDVEQGGVGP